MAARLSEIPQQEYNNKGWERAVGLAWNVGFDARVDHGARFSGMSHHTNGAAARTG